jgi:hypothetical protein
MTAMLDAEEARQVVRGHGDIAEGEAPARREAQGPDQVSPPPSPRYRYHISDPVTGRPVLSTDNETWARNCARELAKRALLGDVDRRQDHELRARFDALMARILGEGS